MTPTSPESGDKTAENRCLLRILAGVPEVAASVKRGLPYRAKYSPELPAKTLTAEELVDYMRDLGWGDIVVRPEGGKYRIVEASCLVQLEERV